MSLKAWYPLIDGSLENKGLDTTPLTLHGTVPFTNGRVRTAPTFSANASNYYTMPPITKVNDFSICCWVKISADVSVSNWIVWQGVVSDNNRFGFVYLGGTNSIGFRIGSFYQNSTIEKDKWYHLCMTMNDTNTVVCYINGNAVGTGLYEGYSFTENETLCLGKNKYTSEPLNGQLQDFRYYDHCLSPKEVKEIAKGLCLHLPLKGTNARPNLFKNSATMFNSTGLAPISTTCTSSPALVFDENAPCGVNGKILRATVNRPNDTVSVAGGYFYNTAMTGIPTLTIGQKYCVSVWARCTANNIAFILGGFMEGHTFVKGSENITLTSEWKRYYAIFTATKTGSTTCFYIQAPIGASGTSEYCCPKLELLSPTPYIPNVDDTQYSDYVLDYEPDCSGNEFDATKYGDLTTSDSNGRYNTAVAFNGTNTYVQGLAPTNSECKEFTIATWVKLNNNTLNPAIYNCRTVSRHGINLIYRGNSSPTGILLDDGIANDVFPNSTLELDTWYHIAVTRDTTERKLYINGEFISSGVTTGNLADMSTKYTVGNIVTGTSIDNNYLKGSLSDFRLYTSVLSADDVKELYETSVSIAHNPPSLTESAYYNYVEEQKHSTFDKSKFTVVGSPTITDDGVVTTTSGYSGNCPYVQIPALGDNWEMVVPFNWENKVARGTETFFRSVYPTYQVFSLGTNGYEIYLWLRDINNTDLNVGFLNITNFTNLLIKITCQKVMDGYLISVLSSNDDGKTWTTNKTQTGTVAPYICQNALTYQAFVPTLINATATMDLKKFSITVDGKEVFSGNKTGLDVIKPDNYTVVGSPVISDDGVASGFSSSNRITKQCDFDLSTANSWKLEMDFVPIDTSYQYLFQFTNINLFKADIETNGKIWVGVHSEASSSAANRIFAYTSTASVILNQSNKVIIEYDSSTGYYITFNGVKSQGISITTKIGNTLNEPLTIGSWYNGSNPVKGSIDLNSFKIYVDGNLVYQPCLKIPYTESKTGIKVVDSTYLDRVKDVYDQHYLERYYTVDETTQTVYEYPLFRDSIHSYEFDEGIQASITKNGIHNATTLTEATKTSMYQNNTDTVTLIEI